jgi:hypothetical protein
MSKRLAILAKSAEELTVYKYTNSEKTIAGIQTNSNFPTIAQISELVEMCKQDFPTLANPEENTRLCFEYKITGWGGRIVTEMGIEFDIPEGANIPPDYEAKYLKPLSTSIKYLTEQINY